MGTFDVCALEHVKENQNYVNTSAVSKLMMVPASGLARDHGGVV